MFQLMLIRVGKDELVFDENLAANLGVRRTSHEVVDCEREQELLLELYLVVLSQFLFDLLGNISRVND